MSTVCLGLPYLFMRRANPLRITDEESVARSAGPMLAIGACSCLVVRHSFSVIRISFVDLRPGGHNSQRLGDTSFSARSGQPGTNRRVRGNSLLGC